MSPSTSWPSSSPRSSSPSSPPPPRCATRRRRPPKDAAPAAPVRPCGSCGRRPRRWWRVPVKAAARAGLSGSLTAPATARLGELVANDAAGAQLRAGHLGSGAVESVDPFAGLSPGAPAAPAPRARRRGSGRRPPTTRRRRRALGSRRSGAGWRRPSSVPRRNAPTPRRRWMAPRGTWPPLGKSSPPPRPRRRECEERLEHADAARAKAAARFDKADAALTAARRRVEGGSSSPTRPRTPTPSCVLTRLINRERR